MTGGKEGRTSSGAHGKCTITVHTVQTVHAVPSLYTVATETRQPNLRSLRAGSLETDDELPLAVVTDQKT